MSNQRNQSNSYVKSLYFIDAPPLSNREIPNKRLSPSRSKPTESFLQDISSIKEKTLSSEKKKNHARYLHVPMNLPVIIKDKSINESKKTINFFLKEHQYEKNSSNKKVNFPYLLKEDSLKTIVTAQKLNEILYKSRKNTKENTSKMLIKELWKKSYHDHVLQLSGIKKKTDDVEQKKIQPFYKRYEELDSYFSENINLSHSNYFGFLKLPEKSVDSYKQKKKSEIKSELSEILNQCKEFNSDMKIEKKYIFIIIIFFGVINLF